jgi:hypothetical protein
VAGVAMALFLILLFVLFGQGPYRQVPTLSPTRWAAGKTPSVVIAPMPTLPRPTSTLAPTAAPRPARRCFQPRLRHKEDHQGCMGTCLHLS